MQEREFQPFNTASVFIRTGSPQVGSFLESALRECQPPRSVKERNLAQLILAERLQRQFEFPDLVKAVEAVAPMYAARFPHAIPKPRALVRRKFQH